MLTPNQVESLVAQMSQELRLPLNAGDRLDVARDTIRATVERLAPVVTLEKLDGPLPPAGIEGAEGEEKPAPTPKPSDGK